MKMSWRLRPGPFGQVIGDAPEQMLLLLDRARVGDGNLNEDQVVGIGDAEITRGVHDVSLRCALGDRSSCGTLNVSTRAE